MALAWKAINWFAYRPTFREWPGIFARLFVLKAVWVTSILTIAALLMGESPVIPGMPLILQIYLWAHGLAYTINLVFWSVISEEVLTRLVPFCMAFVLVRRGADEIRTLAVTAALTSLVFGLQHAYNRGDPDLIDVVLSICVQGVSGIVYAAAFLKGSSLQLRYALYGFAACVMLHMIWDTVVLTIGYVHARL